MGRVSLEAVVHAEAHFDPQLLLRLSLLKLFMVQDPDGGGSYVSHVIDQQTSELLLLLLLS